MQPVIKIFQSLFFGTRKAAVPDNKLNTIYNHNGKIKCIRLTKWIRSYISTWKMDGNILPLDTCIIMEALDLQGWLNGSGFLFQHERWIIIFYLWILYVYYAPPPKRQSKYYS